ncbi:MAG TPA: tetratricopeptide repeat protein [Terriglobales bacterium]|jgi:tetratricopeptide (TPR) repeat protein|nr:tetratricopeptide repeat protein [Terriglobales bacterium]
MQWLGPEMRRWLGILAFVALLGVRCSSAGEANAKDLIQQAFDFHQKGQFSEALPLLHRAHDLAPEDYFVNLLLGIDSLRTGQAKTAVPFLKKASRLRPKEEYPLAYLGEAYARQDLYGEAAEAYIKAARLSPGSSESAVAFVDFALARFASMSELLRSSKKGLAAEYRLRALAQPEADPSRLPLLQRAADLDPTAPGIWSDLARAALVAGNVADAKVFTGKALQADPDDQAAEIAEAQIAAQNSQWERAIKIINSVGQNSPEMLSRASRQWPPQLAPPLSNVVSGSAAKFFDCVRGSPSNCHLAFGTTSTEGPSVLFREQRWEQLTKLPTPQSSQTVAWFQRGVGFAKLDDCPKAIPSLERGLSKSYPDVYGMLLLSWCYSREAGKTAEQVQQSANDEAPVHVMRGDILLRLRAKAAMAVSEYQQALAQDANDPAVLERLAEAQLGAGQADAARDTAQAAIKIDPQRMAAKSTLAKIAMQERDYSDALPYLRELVARNPQDESIRIELGKACAQTGALGDAWKNLAPALAHGYPDEKGSLHYLLGSVLKKMGRDAEAQQAFSAATELSEAFQQKSYRDQDADAQR